MASAAGVGTGKCQQVCCPVCALAAVVTGEQHPLVTVIAYPYYLMFPALAAFGLWRPMVRRLPPDHPMTRHPLVTLFVAAFAGTVWGMVLMARRTGGGQTALPFGTLLCPAAMLVFLWGDDLTRAYLGLVLGR